MKTADLILRCYMVRRDDRWEAFCIDLCLATQADSATEAKQALEAQIFSYVEEALTIDKEYAAQLLSRKAPPKQIATYHAIRLLSKVVKLKGRIGRVFSEAMPVHVGNSCRA